MKKIKITIGMIIAIFLNVALMGIGSLASGPLDGQIVEESLLTSESKSSDERPLVVQEGEVVPYGVYLSSGASEITDRGNWVVYISGQTYCNKTSDKVQVFLYLEKLTNGGWTTIKNHSNTVYNTYSAYSGISFSVQKGYYYRVRGLHIAQKGSTTESCTTYTHGIYIS